MVFVFMDTRFLESFVTVVELGSIAEAARRLNLTPAGVAQQLRSLEGEIGSPLVSRSGRTVKPTEAGLAMLEPARALLKQTRDLKAFTAADKIRGELRLGATQTALVGMLPGILAPLVKKYPNVEIYIVPGTSMDLYHRVVRGDLDAAMIVEPRFTIPKTCSWRTLRTEPLVTLIPGDMPEEDPHKILAREPLIRYDRNHWGGQIVDRYLRKFGIVTHDRLELDALDAIATLVDRGLGVALVPDWAPPWPAGLSIQKLAVNNNIFVRRIGLLSAHMSPRARLTRILHDESLAAQDNAYASNRALETPRDGLD